MLTKEEKDKIYGLTSYKDHHKSQWTGELTPIFNAVARGDLDEVRELIDQGVRPAERYIAGTILDVAIKSKEVVMEYDSTNNDHDKIIKILLESGVDPNKVINQDNKGALSRAVENGYHEIAVNLLKSGADPNLKNKNGLTALIMLH